MSQLPRRYCVFGCDHLVTFGIPMHRFPNPEKHPDLFKSWVTVIGEKLKETDPNKVYKNKRICDHHFDPIHKVSGSRLKPAAIPSINLCGMQRTCSTFAYIDHCYSRPQRESFQPLMDITNLPGPSRPIAHQSIVTEDSSQIPVPSGSMETTCVVVTDRSQEQKPCTRFKAGMQRTCSAFADSRPQRQSFQPLMDITNPPGPSRPIAHQSIVTEDSSQIPVPSGSMETTCVVVTDRSQERKPCTRFNAERTFEFLRNKTTQNCARKVKQKENEIRRLRQKVKTFKLRLRQLEKSTNKINFEKLTQNMTSSAKLFTRMQCMEGQKKKKGHRFTLDEKVLSLSLYKKSPKAYKLMSKHFTLPSRKILKSLLSQVKLNPGINDIIFKELKATVSKLKPQDRLCTLIFDEMSIAPQLFYNSYTDDIVGFEHFGDEKTSNFANHALVFMIKGIKKNFKQPVAYFFTQALSTLQLKKMITEVITNVQATGLKIIATVCDQGAPNPSAINKLVADSKAEFAHSNKEYKNDVILINNSEIIPLFDVPHLLKGIRNNLLNKDLTYQYNHEQKNVRWEYFQKIYAADKSHGELRLLPKITREHIDKTKLKKMRVKHAAQLFSHSMAVATDNLVARGDINTECLEIIPFVIMIDKLFDSLNSSSFSIPRGKKYRAAVKRNSPNHALWQDALQFMKSIKFMAKRGDGTTYKKHVPTVNNFIKTVEGFKCLWQLLSREYGLDAMLTRNFNQDPLENFFGSIRSLGARNVAPNCMGFEGAFKTLLLNNMSSDHSVNSNCEEDSGKCLQSLSFFIKNKVNYDAASQSQNVIIDKPLDVMQTTPNDSGSDQRTYVCGWALIKCLQKVVKGRVQCKSKLLGNSNNEKYRYIHVKEFEKDKELLCYPSDCLVACFQDIQNTTIAFLNSECHKIKIKERISAFVDMFTDFTFMDCDIHKHKLKEIFLAYNALKALYHHRSPIGLVGNHVDVMSGRWTAQDAGIGGGVDSYFEYLVKGAILLERPELMSMFNEARQVIDRYLKKDDWYVWATMLRGHVTLPVFQSLESYWPGLLSLIGDSDTAMRIIHNYHSVWRQYGFTPEVYNLGTGEASSARESYPLRPELIESIMYLYRETRDPILLQMGEDIIRSIQHSARTPCGYATIKDVRDHRKEDRMESFFLAETTKYLYLLFDPDNFIHNPGKHGTVIATANGECIVDVGGYIFNTEAHPIDPTMLYCCQEAREGINISEVHRIYQILEEEDNIQFMTMIDASTKKNASVQNSEDRKQSEVTNATEASKGLKDNKLEQDQVLIKTETRTGYVNMDGTEREKVKNESNLRDVVKERIVNYYNNNTSSSQDHEETKELIDNPNDPPTIEPVGKVDVDDIIVPGQPQEAEKIQPPSSTKAKEAFKMLPTVIQDFLNSDWKSKPKCEPQHILERIRKENKYPDHPDVDKYELLLTPAQSFLQRISLAGEFLNKKQLEL